MKRCWRCGEAHADHMLCGDGAEPPPVHGVEFRRVYLIGGPEHGRRVNAIATCSRIEVPVFLPESGKLLGRSVYDRVRGGNLALYKGKAK